MDENGWDYGQDDEELFELAMHPEQYRAFKSGQAKKQFLADLQKAKDAKLGGGKVSAEEIAAIKHAKADAVKSPLAGQLLWSFGGEGVMAPCVEPFIGQTYKEGDTFCYLQTKWGEIMAIPAAMGGKLVDISVKPGQNIRQGDTIAWIQREG
jgi:pyruvate carboxylase subunit B